MRKSKWFLIIGLVLLASVMFMSCDNAVAPPIVEPPVVEPPVVPIPPTFEEVIAGNFWTVNRVERYQDTGYAVALNSEPVEDPYALDVCSYWDENEEIWFFLDENGDGIISPSEPSSGPLSWEMVGTGEIEIEGELWTISYFDGDGWAIEKNVSGTELGDILGNDYGPYEGWIRIHYIPCDKMFDDGIVTKGGFSFVFDDMGDALMTDCTAFVIGMITCDDDCMGGRRSPSKFLAEILLVEDDEWDGFVVSSGGNLILIANSEDYSVIATLWVDENDDVQFYIKNAQAFIPDLVYDMMITVDSADVALFEFDATILGETIHAFDVETMLDKSQLGDFIREAINDAEIFVVTP